MSAPRTASQLLLLASLCALPWSAAHGHIGPSTRDNNRYLKLTLYGNRARLLYTVYLGDQPGRQARRRMDSDRDGAISDEEKRVFANELAATVAGNLEVAVDGAPIAIEWSSSDVGLGIDSVDAGAFSVDLVQWLCLPAPDRTHEHSVVLYDHWHPPQAGESEVRVEESAGVRVTRSRLGSDNPVSQLRFKWLESRPPHPLDRDGLHIELTVDPAVADVSLAPTCAAGAESAASAASAQRAASAAPPSPNRARARSRWWLWASIAGALLAIVLALRAYRKTNG